MAGVAVVRAVDVSSAFAGGGGAIVAARAGSNGLRVLEGNRPFPTGRGVAFLA